MLLSRVSLGLSEPGIKHYLAFELINDVQKTMSLEFKLEFLLV